jgi:hypothetical protein
MTWCSTMVEGFKIRGTEKNCFWALSIQKPFLVRRETLSLSMSFKTPFKMSTLIGKDKSTVMPLLMVSLCVIPSVYLQSVQVRSTCLHTFCEQCI